MDKKRGYEQKKRFFDSLITLYGRHVVLEVLKDSDIDIHALHLSLSNKDEGAIKRIKRIAADRGVRIEYHEKRKLSFISKNAKQDQGVAIDIVADNYRPIEALHVSEDRAQRFLALDAIQNPQNLGMIIRSAAAGNIDGIILGYKRSAKLSPLVMKASAGTMFKIPIYRCDELPDALAKLPLKKYLLSSYADNDIYDFDAQNGAIFVLGNESEGVSQSVANVCDASLRIPMRRGVESLNVAATATILSFLR